MALVQVDKATVSSTDTPVDSLIVEGINSDDVYVVVGSGIHTSVDTGYLYVRVTKDVAGTTTPQSASSYGFATTEYKATGSFSAHSFDTGRSNMYFGNSPLGNATGENSNIYYTLYNFNSSSEYSYMTVSENVFNSTSSSSHGSQGGFVYRVNETNNGFAVIGDSQKINSGSLVLYKVV